METWQPLDLFNFEDLKILTSDVLSLQAFKLLSLGVAKRRDSPYV